MGFVLSPISTWVIGSGRGSFAVNSRLRSSRRVRCSQSNGGHEAARIFRMVTNGDEGGEDESAEDEAPSDTYVPPGTELGQELGRVFSNDETERAKLTTKLLRLCAITNRGQFANDNQRETIDTLASSLEALSPTMEAVNSVGFEGVWTLAYISAPLFKTQPLLMAGATPLLEINNVRSRIELGIGRVTTDVEVVAFPQITATVRTTSTATPVGSDRIELVVDKSTIIGDKLGGQVDLGGLSVDIPIAKIYERIRGATPESYFDTYYLDDEVRISRSKSGTLYIYVKE